MARRRALPAGPSPLPGLGPGLGEAWPEALLELAIERAARVMLDREKASDNKRSARRSPRQPMIGDQIYGFALRFTYTQSKRFRVGLET